jgi:hypothetical protein
MKFRSATLLLALIFVLLGAHRLPAPIREEATPQPSAAAKRKAESKSSTTKAAPAESGMNSRSIQVVLTDNTRAAILYLKNYVQQMNDAPFAVKPDVQPDEIVEKLRLTLASRFTNVSISNSATSSGSGLTMSFDLQAHVATYSGKKNTVSIVATFKNNSGRTIQTISSSGTSTMPYPAFATRFPQAVSAAFADFSQKLAAAR